jgi:hypothetical protein
MHLLKRSGKGVAMRKILAISLLALCLLFTAACKGKANGIPNASTIPASSSIAVTSPGAATTPGSVIIAESSNAISDKEKQVVLDNLARELDNAFNSSGNLDDLDDSDLNTDNIK